MASKLGDRLTAYYDSRQLDDVVVERMMLYGTGRPISRYWVAAAACLVLLIGDYLSVMYRTGGNLQSRVVDEVLVNHKKRMRPEYYSANVDELGARMDKLDFDLGAVSRVQIPPGLVGARYCSIQGRVAAQLKFEDLDTLYVTGLDDEFKGLPDRRIMKDDVVIKIWKENDLLFVHASDVESPRADR